MGAGDSKLQFKSHLNYLSDKRIPANNHDFWSVLFTTPIGADDVFQLVDPDDVRKLRNHQPENLATVIYKCVEYLYLFSYPVNYKMEETSARNSLQLLTRILPFVFEHDEDAFVKTLFFDNIIPYAKKALDAAPTAAAPVAAPAEEKKQEPEKKTQEITPAVEETPKPEETTKTEADTPAPASEATTTTTTTAEQKTEETPAATEATEAAAVAAASETASTAETADKYPESAEKAPEPAYPAYPAYPAGPERLRLKTTLAEALITTVMRMLFVPTFTVPEDAELGEEEIILRRKTAEEKGEPVPSLAEDAATVRKHLLWEGGLVVPAGSVSSSTDMIVNRTNVLRCLLSCLCQSLYVQPEQTTHVENRFLEIACSKRVPYTATLFYSLLNTIATYDPTGYLPYTTVIRSDPKEKLVETSLHVLCALLQYRPEYFQQYPTEDNKTVVAKTNVYATYVSNLKQEDMPAVYNGLSVLLYNIIDANNTYLPGSQRAIPFHSEVLVLSWKLLEHSKAFGVHLARDGDLSKILIPLLYCMQQTAGDTSRFPLFQLCSFIVLQLSGIREFGVAMNKKYELKVPLQYPAFIGTYADLLVLILQQLIAHDKGVLRSMYDCFLTTICNISPYCKTLSMTASIKLVSLFEAFAYPKHLYTSESNHKLVRLLLDAFNNIIQYYMDGNAQLIYSILRRKKVFYELVGRPNLAQVRELIEKKQQAVAEKIQKQQKEGASPVVLPKPFIPTDEWVESWKSTLPIYTILYMLQALVPEVERLCAKENATEEDVLDYLRNITLVGLLPVPHTIIIRSFMGNDYIHSFLLTYLWGLIYLKSLDQPDVAIFDA